MEFTTHSAAETERLAAAFAKQLPPGSILAFVGGLGAGKTAFTRGLAQGLGVTGEVSSPTFALVHEYQGNPALIHFDMYRVTTLDDLYTTGFFDYLDGNNILAIEWSENIEAALPEEAIFIQIEPMGETIRRITIKGGPAFEYSGD
ncbi:MAG: tRNA (adenosine(37)-N6)-threonylcarbamoyltransferase complex ATPase subunit type 1 TsaE [Oscillospiraceae bacterium]|jgi:tRNA threonylcarbamoyladenosine biosynthesis protein TsaE